MSYHIIVKVDRDHSVDPSYIVHYRVTDNGRLLGDGIVQYHRQAVHNDIPVTGNIPPVARNRLVRQIEEAVQGYINQRR